MEAHEAKLGFFKAAICQQLLEKLVGHYLLLTDEELQVWENSPEEFSELFIRNPCAVVPLYGHKFCIAEYVCLCLLSLVLL